MKLVKLLAKELETWAITTVCYVQDPCGSVWPCKIKPNFDGCEWIGDEVIDQNDDAPSLTVSLSSDYASAVVTKSMWQAERDRQKGGEWKRHRGGKCPVPAGTKVSTRHRDGEVVDVHFHTATTGSGPATMNAIWKHTGDGHDIMAYKIISQPQAEDGLELVQGAQDAVISCIAHNDGAGKVTHGPIMMGDEVVGEASPEWNQQAKWDQIDGPLRWRDEVTELNAHIEKYTRERDALIERLASEGFALITPVVSVVSGFSGVDMDDWRNWKAGDVVIALDSSTGYRQGTEYIIKSITHDSLKTVLDSKGSKNNGWSPEKFKFVRRP